MRVWLVLGQVSVSPSSAGMPGAALIQRLLGWLQMTALWGSLAAVLAGAVIYGFSERTGSYGSATSGKKLALGGAVGAALAGLAPTIVNSLFKAV
ncbi:MAG: hypothetical protein HYX34_11115 [Actinobacteria bacterium]|nr:hypothetical protein [Actinomycetota bacterium]